MMKKIVVFLMFILANNLFAQEINTESPSFSAGGMTVPKNTFQVETNFGLRRKAPYEYTELSYTLPTMLLRYGMTDRFEIRVNPSMRLDPFKYSLIALYVGAKYNIIGQNNDKFQMSIIANYGLPIVFENLKIDLNSFLALNYNLTEKHSLGANLGYQYQKHEFYNARIDVNGFFSTLIYSYQITDGLSCFAEAKLNVDKSYFTSAYSNFPPSNSTFNSYFWDIGLLYKFGKRYQIDYVYGMDFDNSLQFHTLGFHFMLNTVK